MATNNTGDRLAQIETRMSEINAQLNDPAADITSLDAEVDRLIEERKTLLAAAETRAALLGKISAGDIGTPSTSIQIPGTVEQRSQTYTVESPEYRTAWLKNLQRRGDFSPNFTEAERRALTIVSGSAGDAVPTQTQNTILEKVTQYAPLLTKINLLKVPGMVQFAVENDIKDAAYHTENQTISSSADTLKKITLSAYEITKLVQISKSVAMMTVPAFETWLTDMLARKIADMITNTIINGTGSNQGTGIEKAATWDQATTSVEVANAEALTNEDVLKLISLLPGGYDARAEFLMSKKTLFMDFMPLQDKNKNDVVTIQGNNYYVYGYPVMLDERVKEHEAYLGDFYTIIGNMPEDITVTSGFDIDTNSYKFLGCAMFDCKPSMDNAFVKLEKAEM